MKLKYCAFTGPDDAVDPRDLSALSKRFPFAEWSILYVPGEEGRPRMPTLNWIGHFRQLCRGTHTGLHLCGDALPALANGDDEVMEIMEGFPRVQLNFEYRDAGAKVDTAQLVDRIRKMPNIEFIFQYGKTYSHLLKHFKDVPNHAVLFDGSAGEGIAPGAWPAPLAGHKCGYAGGMNCDNMQAHLEKISAVTPKDYVTWVDQETGARTHDKFDLGKVLRTLEIAAPYAIS